MGIVMPITGTATSSAMPIIEAADERIAPGTLLLLDASHSKGGFGVGVPANAAYLQNIAWKQLNAAVGGAAIETSPAMNAQIVRQNGTGLTLERSTKGGLHGIVSQAGDLAANVGLEISLPSSLRTYLAANADHEYFVAAALRITRAAKVYVTTRPATVAIQNITSPTSNYLASLDLANNNPLPSVKRTGSLIDPGPNATGGRTVRAVGALWTGTTPANAASLRSSVATWGARQAYTGMAGTDAAPSWILYALAVEDLTLSGRSYSAAASIFADVAAMDFGAGGKYAGDSFTVP